MRIDAFEKRHKKVVCIDSDGTALDTMNVKHIRCFGPCFVSTWGLDAIRSQALDRWNRINLYEKTRGKNRFITLLIILEEYNGKYVHEDLAPLRDWVESGKELSGKSLRQTIETNSSEILKKTLSWSDDVDKAIASLTAEDKKPFDGAEDFLKNARGKADIAVVSSAGEKALRDEWQRYKLDTYVDVLTSQEDGTKAACIQKLLAKGYEPQDVLMVGDSFPDIDAATECGVYFYPILAGKETFGWKMLREEYFGRFLADDFGNVQKECILAFYKNLNTEG